MQPRCPLPAHSAPTLSSEGQRFPRAPQTGLSSSGNGRLESRASCMRAARTLAHKSSPQCITPQFSISGSRQPGEGPGLGMDSASCRGTIPRYLRTGMLQRQPLHPEPSPGLPLSPPRQSRFYSSCWRRCRQNGPKGCPGSAKHCGPLGPGPRYLHRRPLPGGRLGIVVYVVRPAFVIRPDFPARRQPGRSGQQLPGREGERERAHGNYLARSSQDSARLPKDRQGGRTATSRWLLLRDPAQPPVGGTLGSENTSLSGCWRKRDLGPLRHFQEEPSHGVPAPAVAEKGDGWFGTLLGKLLRSAKQPFLHPSPLQAPPPLFLSPTEVC